MQTKKNVVIYLKKRNGKFTNNKAHLIWLKVAKHTRNGNHAHTGTQNTQNTQTHRHHWNAYLLYTQLKKNKHKQTIFNRNEKIPLLYLMQE